MASDFLFTQPVTYRDHISVYASVPKTEQSPDGLLVYLTLQNSGSPATNTYRSIEIVSGIQGFTFYRIGEGKQNQLLGDFIDMTGLDGQRWRDPRVKPGERLDVAFLCRLPMDRAEEMLEVAERMGAVELVLCFQFFAAYPAGELVQKTDRYDPLLAVQVPKTVVEGWVALWSSAREAAQDIPGVPASVYQDYVEAVRAANVGAPRASLSMSRRALQSALKHRGAKSEKLYDQIEELAEAGALTQATKNLAHGIRQFGNFGAHPGDDQLEDVGLEDAKLALQVLRRVLRELYAQSGSK